MHQKSATFANVHFVVVAEYTKHNFSNEREINMAKTKTAKKGVKTAKGKAAVAGRGGARKGAGRPSGTGRYGCKTKAVRVPEHLVDEIQAFALKKIKAEKK